MSVTIFYPPLAAFAVLIVVIVFVLLTYGDFCCKLRHTTFPENRQLGKKAAYGTRDMEMRILTEELPSSAEATPIKTRAAPTEI